MSLTADTYTESVFYLISQGNPEADAGVYRTAIRATMSNAITQTCIMSLTQPWRSDLEHTYPLALTNGTATYGTATDLLPESILACNKITHGTLTMPLRIVGSRLELVLQGVPDATMGAAYVAGSAIETMYRGAGLSGTINVLAVQIPGVTGWPDVAAPHLFKVGAQLAIDKVRGVDGV